MLSTPVVTHQGLTDVLNTHPGLQTAQVTGTHPGMAGISPPQARAASAPVTSLELGALILLSNSRLK